MGFKGNVYPWVLREVGWLLGRGFANLALLIPRCLFASRLPLLSRLFWIMELLRTFFCIVRLIWVLSLHMFLVILFSCVLVLAEGTLEDLLFCKQREG